jgi:hypothetical protein
MKTYMVLVFKNITKTKPPNNLNKERIDLLLSLPRGP